MADESIPGDIPGSRPNRKIPKVAKVACEQELIPLLDENGGLHYEPREVVDFWLAKGVTSRTVTISYQRGRAPDEWLTVKQAAALLMDVRGGMSLQTARITVVRAARAGVFRSVGDDRNRRIEPHTFSSWRLQQREKDLDDS